MLRELRVKCLLVSPVPSVRVAVWLLRICCYVINRRSEVSWQHLLGDRVAAVTACPLSLSLSLSLSFFLSEMVTLR